jgi:hypothetical protein
MSYPQLYTCAGILTLSMVASAWLLMWAIGLVSMPDPAQIAVEYSRPAHVWHAAEVERRAP